MWIEILLISLGCIVIFLLGIIVKNGIKQLRKGEKIIGITLLITVFLMVCAFFAVLEYIS